VLVKDRRGVEATSVSSTYAFGRYAEKLRELCTRQADNQPLLGRDTMGVEDAADPSGRRVGIDEDQSERNRSERLGPANPELGIVSI
jgi:hypothetical protein